MGNEISHDVTIHHNNLPKKSFADVELEKKVKQIFGISNQRPRTSMTRQEYDHKYEIGEAGTATKTQVRQSLHSYRLKQ
jgi:hypothetical protein